MRTGLPAGFVLLLLSLSVSCLVVEGELTPAGGQAWDLRLSWSSDITVDGIRWSEVDRDVVPLPRDREELDARLAGVDVLISEATFSVEADTRSARLDLRVPDVETLSRILGIPITLSSAGEDSGRVKLVLQLSPGGPGLDEDAPGGLLAGTELNLSLVPGGPDAETNRGLIDEDGTVVWRIEAGDPPPVPWIWEVSWRGQLP